MTEIHTPNIYGPIELANDQGTSGQVLTSQGASQSIWSNSNLTRLYLFTDKNAQAIVLGPSDIGWNVPAADAINGVAFNGTTQFTLTANRTYKLIANITPSVAALAYSIQWVNSANVAVGGLNQPANGLANLAHVHAFSVFRPLVNTIVKVRLTSGVALTVSAVCSVFIETVD